MPCFVCFLNFPCNKKWPKNKSFQNALNFNMFFSEYFWISGANNIRGGARGVHKTPGRIDNSRHALVGCGPHVVPSLTFFAHVISYLQKKITIALSLSRVLALKPVNFDLFARSSVSETVLGDCYLVCDSSIAPISFCFSGLYFEELATDGAVVDEFACWILRVLSSLNACYGLYVSYE